MIFAFVFSIVILGFVFSKPAKEALCHYVLKRMSL